MSTDEPQPPVVDLRDAVGSSSSTVVPADEVPDDAPPIVDDADQAPPSLSPPPSPD